MHAAHGSRGPAPAEATTREKILLSWSGGKDSAMTLYEIQQDRRYEIVALLTTVTEGYDRISMHGVRRALLERQAESLGVGLETVYIPPRSTNEIYESRMAEALGKYQREGIQAVAFGDLFLEDIRRYREENLAKRGMRGVFPIWKRDTTELARTFIRLGFKALTICVDPRVLDPSFAGQMINEDFLRRLPPHVDPCGENGEFHSFVFGGPLFREEVRFTVGETVTRDSFCFCDLLPE